MESLGDVLGTGDSALEVDEASPLITHGVLALGVFVAAFEAVRHLFLIVLGWVLNNLMLLWWVFCSGYGLAVAFLGQFGWMVLGLYMDAR